MSSVQEFASDRNRFKFEFKKPLYQSNRIGYAFKSKRYLLKINNNKKLKRKLKKYKVRQDGQEDQDVIDVSHTLLTILQIRSPKKINSYQEIDTTITERPTNYIIKMVRKKLTQLSSKDLGEKINIPDCEEATTLDAQNKKEVNAFKLMMESRHKSLGSNSPGKEREFEEIELQEKIQDKEVKIKRKLLLQKLAEAKGSLRKKELEENHDKYLDRQMRKREKKFKSMIINSNHDITKKPSTQEQIPNKNIVKEIPKKLCVINLFKDNENCNLTKLPLTNEDEDFLRKLSPSMRKKENMLCYFNKLPKESIELNNEIITQSVSETKRVKVKLPPKKKKKKRKTVLLEDNLEDDDAKLTVSNESKMMEYGTTHNEGDMHNNKVTNTENTADSYNSGRAKRNIKRPKNYVDEIALCSSDSDEPIFTPKKKKSNLEIVKTVQLNKDNKSCNNKAENRIKKRIKKASKIILEKPLILAPIFKTNLNCAVNEEKIKFLKSGVPEKLKKIADKHKICQTLFLNFPTVVHVQQISKEYTNTSSFTLPELYSEEDIILENHYSFFRNLFLSSSTEPLVLPVSKYKATAVLQNVKQSYPKFPVYRMYKLLKSKSIGACNDTIFSDMNNSIEIINNSSEILSENLENLDWSLKYRPNSASEIIGNFDSVRELKKWLTSWTENDNTKPIKKHESDSSDFCYSDSDSRGEFNSLNNFLILTGPVGSGKTSSVYAIAAELAMKVIEVNASSKRTGKIMLQDLQEATQSHKVNRGKGSSTENSQMFQEIIASKKVSTNKKRGRPRKLDNSISLSESKNKQTSQQCSQESVKTCMSLILIDDADIVFDQDEGFCAAIAQLIQCSKRPVVLVSETMSCLHLRRFTRHGKIIRFKSLLPKMLGTWLDLMCLADSGLCYPGTGAKALDFHNGDIRKTIHSLHFYISTQSQMTNAVSQTVDDELLEDVNENSCKSWDDGEHSVQQICNQDLNMWDYISEQHLYLNYSLNSNNVWRNLLRIYNHDIKTEKNMSQQEQLDNVAFLIDNLSITDVLGHNKHVSKKDILFQTKPWFSVQKDSLSENENLENFNKHLELSSDIGCSLVSTTASHAKDVFGLDDSICKPSSYTNLQRKQEDLVSRHNALTDALNPGTTLDRRALALDYWSACRSICRIEKTKSYGNYRRNNRYCHYLKSLNVMCKNDTFDNLADSLTVEDAG